MSNNPLYRTLIFTRSNYPSRRMSCGLAEFWEDLVEML